MHALHHQHQHVSTLAHVSGDAVMACMGGRERGGGRLSRRHGDVLGLLGEGAGPKLVEDLEGPRKATRRHACRLGHVDDDLAVNGLLLRLLDALQVRAADMANVACDIEEANRRDLQPRARSLSAGWRGVV